MATFLFCSFAGAELQGDLIMELPDETYLRGMLPLNGGLWLAVTTGPAGGEVWFSDRTPVGTALVKPLGQFWTKWAWYWDAPETMTVGGTVFFTAEKPETFGGGGTMWMSDGTFDGTTRISDSLGVLMGEVNGIALLYTWPGIWRSDGTDAGTYTIKTGFNWFRSPKVLSNVVYFGGGTSEHGQELWRTDGTEDGTHIVKDLNPGAGQGCGESLFVFGDAVYFEAFASGIGGGLGRSDGTADGTSIIKVFDEYFVVPMGYGTDLGDSAVFFINDYEAGIQLWRTDGTEAGTVLIRDMSGSSVEASPSKIVVTEGNGYFRADDGVHGRELWKTDGTEAGTLRLTDLDGDTYGIYGPADGFVYFTGVQNELYGLFRSDGTAEGTNLVEHIETSDKIDDIWAQDGFTYIGLIEYSGAYDFKKLGRISESGIEWLELRDVASGATETASPVTRPITIGNTTYFCGWPGYGLWAVNNQFQFTAQPYGSWNTVGERLALNVACAGNVGTLSYQWFKDGEAILDATDAAFLIESLTLDDEGAYTCRVTDAAKTVYETQPALIEVFAEGELPAAGVMALAFLAVVSAVAGAGMVMRKK